jgi:hypothetical protein
MTKQTSRTENNESSNVEQIHYLEIRLKKIDDLLIELDNMRGSDSAYLNQDRKDTIEEYVTMLMNLKIEYKLRLIGLEIEELEFNRWLEKRTEGPYGR